MSSLFCLYYENEEAKNLDSQSSYSGDLDYY